MSSSGLVLLTPGVDARFADIRAAHDPAARQGMPAHLTVLYPFMDPKGLGAQRRERLAKVIAGFRPFDLAFSRIGRFPEVLWIAPDDPQPVIEMVRAVVAAFPGYPPYGGLFSTIIPHATVAHGEGLDLGALEPQVRSRLSPPIVERVSAVALFSTVRRRWVEVDRFELASR